MLVFSFFMVEVMDLIKKFGKWIYYIMFFFEKKIIIVEYKGIIK